jgi:DNA transformation protein and related proteins
LSAAVTNGGVGVYWVRRFYWCPAFAGHDENNCRYPNMDADVIRDLFAAFGAIDIRRMFSGAGVFVDGRMIALIARDVIYLKADAATIPAFEREGLGPFTYATKNGEHTLNSYWRMPERLYDDPEELARWAREAHAVALRALVRKPDKKSSSEPKAKKSAAARKVRGVRRPASAKAKARPRGRSRT